MNLLKPPPEPSVPGSSRLPAAGPTPPRNMVSRGLVFFFAFDSRYLVSSSMSVGTQVISCLTTPARAVCSARTSLSYSTLTHIKKLTRNSFLVVWLTPSAPLPLGLSLHSIPLWMPKPGKRLGRLCDSILWSRSGHTPDFGSIAREVLFGKDVGICRLGIGQGDVVFSR